MNHVLKRTLQSVLTVQQCTNSLRIVPGISSKFDLGNGTGQLDVTRGIKQYVKKVNWVLHARRKKEKLKYPERFRKPNPRYAFVEWNYNAEIFAAGKRLGEDFNEDILREALTDQSYIHKEKKKQEELGIDTEALDLKNNDQLAELGYTISKAALMDFMRKEFPLLPAEGQDALVKHLVSQESMADVASNLGFKDLILCEEYPPTNETFARAMFAIIGAVEKSCGLERAQKFVVDFLASLLCGKDVNDIWNVPRPWAMMTDHAKKKGLDPVEARIIREAGRNTIHAAFLVGIYDKNKQLLGTGAGESLDIAQEMAARDVLAVFFNTKDPRRPFQFQSSNIPYKLIPHVRNINK